MKNIFLSTLAFFALAFTTNASAQDSGGLFLEPAVTYEQGRGEMDLGIAGKPDGDLEGLGVGLRFGGHVSDILFLALDANYSEPEFTDENGDFDYDLKSWTAGVTLGLQTPLAGLRVWGGYIPFGEIELDGRGSNQSNLTYKDPDMWKLGAGFRVGIVSLNLEYLTGTYEKLNVRNAGPITGTYSEKADRDSWIASVSFPLAL